jgi:hypothetical protein
VTRYRLRELREARGLVALGVGTDELTDGVPAR